MAGSHPKSILIHSNHSKWGALSTPKPSSPRAFIENPVASLDSRLRENDDLMAI
jgi:hypothetical protein